MLFVLVQVVFITRKRPGYKRYRTFMLLVTFLVAMTGNKKGRVYFVCKLGDRQRSHGGAWLTSCPTEAASHIVPRVRRKGVRNALI